MKRTQGLTQEEIMQSYQLANKALRNYVFRLEEKIANYESLLKHFIFWCAYYVKFPFGHGR